MKKIILVLAFSLICAGVCFAQTTPNPPSLYPHLSSWSGGGEVLIDTGPNTNGADARGLCEEPLSGFQPALGYTPLNPANNLNDVPNKPLAITNLGALASGGAAGGDLSGVYPNPTVAQINGAVVPATVPVVGTNSNRQIIASVAANSQRSVASPTAPASTSGWAMQGLSGSITPSRTGNVLIMISGTVVSPAGTTAGLGVAYQISYGTGAAPANSTTIIGTQVGSVQEYTNGAIVTAADVHQPFSTQAVVTGLTVGTAYWIDLAAESLGTASDMGLSNVLVSVIEQ
jgi:hypothetical protein